jgi:hypothetical protein
MSNLEQGLVLASKAPTRIVLDYKPAYLSKFEQRMLDRGFDVKPRPVMFVNTPTKEGDKEEYDTIQEAITVVLDDVKSGDLPKSLKMYFNGAYLTVSEVTKIATNLVAYHFKNKGHDIDVRKFQWWTETEAAKKGLAYATSPKPKAATKKKAGTKKSRY